jgi:hypothetical protein
MDNVLWDSFRSAILATRERNFLASFRKTIEAGPAYSLSGAR